MKKNSENKEIIDSISSLIDHDIDNLIKKNKLPIECGDFDQDGVFANILSVISANKNNNIKKIVRWASSIAALVAIAALMLYYAPLNNLNSEKLEYSEIFVPKGEKILVLMTDGSRVWLNSDSRLKYPKDFLNGERNVELEGEGYFEVAKDATRPFTVTMENVKVKVLGTSFNIKAYACDSNIIATLDEGRIEIGDVKNATQSYAMTPGETAIYDKVDHKYSIIKDDFYDDATAWRENRIAFRNSSLNGVLTTLSRKYNVEFEIKDSKIKGYTYNMICNVNDLRSVMDMISAITPVKFEKVSEGNYSVMHK